jgi:hypothetical protein
MGKYSPAKPAEPSAADVALVRDCTIAALARVVKRRVRGVSPGSIEVKHLWGNPATAARFRVNVRVDDWITASYFVVASVAEGIMESRPALPEPECSPSPTP